MDEPVVDIGILTIRDDEFRAVLKCFPTDPLVHKGRYREYALRTAEAGHGARYRLAILRLIDQGNGEAQEAARDFLDDLEPTLLLVVGIGGGVPSDDFSLGDVILSTRILDFSVEARKFAEGTTYNIGGGPIAKSIAAGVANLSAREAELGEWWRELPAKPPVSLRAGQFYGPPKWQRLVREKLTIHYGRTSPPQPPLFSAGAVASSDRLVKDPRVLFPWITTARGIQAVEMESAGVHRATRDRTPMLSVRALSDIVGFKRHDAWTKYACASAAAFAAAYLRTQPVPLRQPKTSSAAERTALGAARTQIPSSVHTNVLEEEEAFANLFPLRHFPETLYVAPATCTSKKAAWAQLNKGQAKDVSRVPGAWTIFEKNLYSLTDPECSRLKTIIDVGGLDQFESRSWAFNGDANQRRIWVQLLNAALGEDLWSLGVRFHGDQEVYAFMGYPDEEPRRLKYANVKMRSTVTVVAHYENKTEKGKPYRFLRHNAFQGRFRLLDGQWYLEVTPTYRFTGDGKELYRFHEKRLAGIKRLERNRSVLSQLLVWQAMLRGPWPRADRARLLEFAPLVSFRFRSEVDESTLTALDAPVIDPSRDEEIE